LWGPYLGALELASGNVEQGGDGINVYLEAFGDELIVGAKGSQGEPQPVGPGEGVTPDTVHPAILKDLGEKGLSTQY
jgi:hypothetical protein